jgi:hypothetical protein
MGRMSGPQEGLFDDEEAAAHRTAPAAEAAPVRSAWGAAGPARVARGGVASGGTTKPGPGVAGRVLGSQSGDASALARAPLSVLAITLLRGVLQREEDERAWAVLQTLQSQVRDHVAVLGLELVIDEAEGHAFLRGRAQSGDPWGDAWGGASADAPEHAVAEASASAPGPQAELPRLVARRPLSYPVSLLLALLRRKLAEVDAGAGDTRLVLSLDDIVETVRVFLPEGPNEARLVDQIGGHVNKIVELGFLRRLQPAAGTAAAVGGAAMFEVRRILKAYVDAQWLSEFDARLQAYRAVPAAEAERSRGRAERGPKARGADDAVDPAGPGDDA